MAFRDEVPSHNVRRDPVGVPSVLYRTVIIIIAALLCFDINLYWSSPTTPNPATGQLIRMFQTHREFFVRGWEYLLIARALPGVALFGLLWSGGYRLLRGTWPEYPVRHSLVVFGVVIAFAIASGMIYGGQ